MSALSLYYKHELPEHSNPVHAMLLSCPGMNWCLQYYLDHDQKLKKFVPIIHNSIVYPVVLDASGTVASLPPVINGAHSAVSSTSAAPPCYDRHNSQDTYCEPTCA